MLQQCNTQTAAAASAIEQAADSHLLTLLIVVPFVLGVVLLGWLMKRFRSLKPQAQDADDTRLRIETENRIIYSALLGISVVTVTQFAQRDSLDGALTVSLYSFAVAIPALVFRGAIGALAGYQNRIVKSLAVTVAQALSNILIGVGLVAIFWHFYPGAGIVSLLTGLALLPLLVYHQMILRRESPDADESEPDVSGDSGRA